MGFAEDMSPLGNATALDCANYCVAMFSDLTRKVTMQNLFNDGGFSNTGVSQKVVDKFLNFNDSFRLKFSLSSFSFLPSKLPF